MARGRLTSMAGGRFAPAAVAAALVVATIGATQPTASASPRAVAAGDPQSVALAAYARLTPSERVGQLFMLGVSATAPAQADVAALQRDHAGNIYLIGDSNAGVAGVARVTAGLRTALTWQGVAPFIGTDQEGGEVQRLHGSGFSELPTPLDQGALSANELATRTRNWSAQLLRAGITMNLAPVADTVPRSVGTKNQPIGRYYREFGYTPAAVAPHVSAVVKGWQAGGVAATLKHFPGLGRATGNTDDSADVTDPTGATSGYLLPFHDGIAAGAQFVMVSSATYPSIDAKHRACFSPTVIASVLRKHEHFTGVVISDSFDAVAVRSVKVADRAVRFLQAGGTMVLDSSPSQLHAMATGVLQRAATDTSFAGIVKADVLRVLTLKAQDRLIQAHAHIARPARSIVLSARNKRTGAL